MKIAAVVVTYNDDYKLKEWVEYHKLYENELYKHIIVDNSSNKEYLQTVRKAFPHSKILERKTNGGSTSAYNDGIKEALSDELIDAIVLIANDIKLEKGGISNLYKFLKSNIEFGMVSPVLLRKDSDIIDDLGCEISKSLYMKPYDVGKTISNIPPVKRIVSSITGGMNMASREFYEKVGLQDENLFMYSDEVDMALRASKCGFKMAVSSEIKSWHQHINPSNRTLRLSYTYYLMGRNKLYLARKHFGFIKIVGVLFYQLLICSKMFLTGLLNWRKIVASTYFIWGIINGLSGNMKVYNFIKSNN